MRSRSSRSGGDVAFAANKPQAAADLRNLDALNNSGASDIALSFCRRERDCLSATDAWANAAAGSAK
jgi:hypothetical protein